ncbi:MAG: peptidylprolyl isomerase [bacterium]|nr:peptidylprolyl isomerase [bacterium]
MRYLLIIISVALLGFLIWGLFFSGLIFNKETPPPDDQNVDGSLTSNTVVLETSMGSIKIALDPQAAPKTAANFEKLVRDSFYNSLTFHRIIPGFVIQGGDPVGNGTGGPGYTVPAEINLPHKRGSIAMARLPDQVNPDRESSGSQFYIALADLPDLDGQYTVFGQVTEGMDVVDQIAGVQTDSSDKPLTPVTINKAYLE